MRSARTIAPTLLTAILALDACRTSPVENYWLRGLGAQATCRDARALENARGSYLIGEQTREDVDRLALTYAGSPAEPEAQVLYFCERGRVEFQMLIESLPLRQHAVDSFQAHFDRTQASMGTPCFQSNADPPVVIVEHDSATRAASWNRGEATTTLILKPSEDTTGNWDVLVFIYPQGAEHNGLCDPSLR